MTGRERFVKACRARGLVVEPYGEIGKCSAPVDVDVAAFLEETGGGRYWALRFVPPANLAEEGETTRYGRPDLPWLEDLTFFAGWQGAYYTLASIPSLADVRGRQPVLYLDLSESTQIVPIASTGDLAFRRLAEHLERRRDPDDEPFFPESVAEAIAGDLDLQTLIATGKLARYGAG